MIFWLHHKASSITTNDQTYVKSHYIDLTTQTESSISVSTSDTKIQHDRKTTYTIIARIWDVIHAVFMKI
jgi:hypothetical protein